MSLSHQLFNNACRYIAGGVNSPVRAFSGVGAEHPIYFKKGNGAYLYDVDNKRYIDYVGTWGASILGHANPLINNAIQHEMKNGLGFGAPSAIETQLAEKICQLMPTIGWLRMVNSGTEATMSAIRLARGYTGRDKIIKFEGCYHGHVDALLVKAGSGALTLGKPTSKGVPEDFIKHTLSLPYNDTEQVVKTFLEQGNEIAAVIVEPICGNMNCVKPNSDFLKTLRELCDRYLSVLIFDEVMTGFRVALGGAQQLYDIKPDLTTLGKIIGGGLPVGAFGGKKQIMRHIAPLGDVYQAGTLSGNPLAMAAGLSALNAISADEEFHQTLAQKSHDLSQGILAAAQKKGVPMSTTSVGGMFGLFFGNENKVSNLEQASQCDIKLFHTFHRLMLASGIYLAPSAFEAGFISSAHCQEDIDETIFAAESAFNKL